MACFTKSLVEWSSRSEEVKKTVIRGHDFLEKIVRGLAYKGIYLVSL